MVSRLIIRLRRGRNGPSAARSLAIAACVAIVAQAHIPRAHAAHTSHVDAPWRVLLIQSYDAQLPAAVLQDQAMRHTLLQSSTRLVDVFTESYDAARFSGPSEQLFSEMVRRKYEGMRFDALVAVGKFAFEFLMRHRAELAPEAPIVFYTIAREDLPADGLPPKTTGIFLVNDFAGTLALARTLQPNARRLVLVAGAARNDQVRVARALGAAAHVAPGLIVERLDALPFADALDRLRSEPRDSVVLYAGLFRDAAGLTYPPGAIVEQIAAASPAPVYTVFENLLGQGAIGGSLTDYAREGAAAGALLADVLEGRTAPDAAPTPPPAPVCALDARRLDYWKIDAARVPAGCEVRFGATGPWTAYRGYVIGVAALVLVQAVLIAMLVLQHRKRRLAEFESRRVRDELAHATRVATLGELTAAISHELNQPLGAILANAEAAEVMLESAQPPLDHVRQVLADIRRDDLHASGVIRRVRKLAQKANVELRPLDVDRDVVHEIEDFLIAEARRRGVNLDVVADPDVPHVIGDPVALRQVLINLVINAMDAVAAQPAGRRRVRIRTTVDERRRVELRVSDTGHGIGTLHLPLMFDSFYSTKAGGLGLGLSIARSIVETHGGQIGAKNNAHGGATFCVFLPPAHAAEGDVVGDAMFVPIPLVPSPAHGARGRVGP